MCEFILKMNPSYLLSSSDSAYSKCEPCRDNSRTVEATFYCLECSNCLCTSCQNHHKKIFRKHTVLDESKKRGWIPLNSKLSRPVPAQDCKNSTRRGCEHTRSEDTNKYCLDHRKLCCSECVKNHRYRNFINLL